MVDDSILDVKINVDTAQALAQLRTANEEFRKFAEQAKAAAAQLTALGSAPGSQVQAGLASAARASNDMGESLVKMKAAAHEGGVGLGFYAREAHALLDELSSGRTRQAEGTFANLALTFLQGKTALIPYAAGLAAVGASLGVVGYKAYEAQKAVRNLRLDAAVNGFQLADAAAAHMRDSVEKLANVGASDAEAIIKPFLAIGNVGGAVAQMLAPIMKQLATEMGGDVAKAAEEAAKRFTDFAGAGLAYVNASRSMTQAEKDHHAAVAAAGQRVQAYAILIDAMSRPLDTLRHQTDAAAAAERDHAQAIQLAASAGYSLEEAERMVGRATEQATQKISEEGGALTALRTQMLSAKMAADTFADGMAAAMKADKFGAGIRDAQGEIAKLEAALAVAPDKATAASGELGRSLETWRDKLKGLQQQQGDPMRLDRDALQQDTDALKHYDDTFRGSDQARLAGHIAALKQMLSADGATAARQHSLQQDLEASEKQLYDSQSKAGDKAAKDVLGAARQSIEEEIQLAEEAARKKAKTYDDDLSHHRVSISGYLGEVKSALNDEITAIQAAYAKELQLAGLTESQKAALRREEVLTVAKVKDEITAEERRAADYSQRAWEGFQSSFNGNFTSQISGLMRGTESWATAFKNVLATMTEDLAKFFVDMGLKAAETAVLQIAAQNQATAGIVASFGLQGAAQAAAGKAGAFAAIQTDMGPIFAGFTAFLAPVLGPAAPGAAAGLMAGVQAQAMGIASADIGMWQVPGDQIAMIHHNELVMPAAQAEAFRSMLSNSANGGGAGGDTTHNQTWNITSNSADARDVARQVAAMWGRNPSMRPQYRGSTDD